MDVPAERVTQLQSIPLLAGLPYSDLERLAAKTREERHSVGTELIKEGTSGSSVYLIVSGQCEVRRKSVERRLSLLGPGTFFGELSIISPSPRSATVSVSEAATLLVLEGQDFRSALSSNNRMAQHLIGVLAERLRNLTDEFAPRMR